MYIVLCNSCLSSLKSLFYIYSVHYALMFWTLTTSSSFHAHVVIKFVDSVGIGFGQILRIPFVHSVATHILTSLTSLLLLTLKRMNLHYIIEL